MAGGEPWTDDEIRRAVAMRLAGVEVRDIATVLGRGTSGVADQLYKRGIKLSHEQLREINRRNVGAMNGANQVPPPRPANNARAATIRFEEHYCEVADRNPGWPVLGYEAAA